jgi:Ribbon-helix-helix protein, copG family.
MATQPRKTVRTSVLLPEEAYARIQRLAETNDVSTAWVIRHALLKFLDSHEDQTELPLRLPKTRKASGER